MRILVVIVSSAALCACGGSSESTGGKQNASSATAAGGTNADGSGSTTTSSSTGTGTSAGTSTSGAQTTGTGGAGAAGAVSSGGMGGGVSDATSAGGTSVGGGGASGGNAGASGLGCPVNVPEQGEACELEPAGFVSAQCSWGDDPRPLCRTRGFCNAGAWNLQSPDVGCDGPPLPEQCSQEPPEPGTACDEANLQCWYSDGTRCSCSPCAGGSGYPVCQTIDPPEWTCSAPAGGCPVPAAQAGTACDDAGASCGLDCELPIVCQGGVWEWGQNACPICAAPDTPVATPSGEQPIAALRVGDPVYSIDAGAVVVVPILRTGRTRVEGHSVLHVVLDDGASLEMSPGHPTADGRRFADLAPGDWLDAGHRVVSSTLVPFDASHTYDILPASSTGAYFAAGSLVGSTLLR